jgi:protein TonB
VEAGPGGCGVCQCGLADLPLEPFADIDWKLSLAPPPRPEPEPEPPALDETPATPEAPSVASASAGVPDTPALLCESPPPLYPRTSVRNGESGTVTCRLSIAADGTVQGVEVLRTSGHPRLDRAAVEALSRWHFQPATVGGRAVASSLDHPVTFRLEG